MAIPFLNHLDLRSVSELQNAILHKTTSGTASDIEGKIIYDTGTDTIKYYSGTSGSGSWISLTGDTNTWRPIMVDTTNNGTANETIGSGETLKLVGGTNITLAESAGVVTITAGASTTVEASGGTARTGAIILAGGTNVTLTESPTNTFTFASTDTNTNQLTTFTIRDDDDDAKVVAQNKFIKFVSATGTAGTNWSGAGTTSDPWIMTITSPDTDTNTDTLQTISNDTTDAERFVTFVTSATGAQAGQSDANFKFNPGTDTLSVTNLIVSGTQTTKNETIQVVTDNTISFEGSTADAHEIHLTGADATADRTITLPDTTGVVNVGYSATVGGATTAEVTHSLGTRLVNVQLFDSSSYETVHADVVRTTVNTIDLTFATAPGSGDVTVLVTRVA